MGTHGQTQTNTVFRCHLAPDPYSIIAAARKQCWGARSDRANRKQAAFCIPGQRRERHRDRPSLALNHTSALLPQTGWAVVNRFFCASRHSCHLWEVEACLEEKRGRMRGGCRVGLEFIVLVLFGHFQLVPCSKKNNTCMQFQYEWPQWTQLRAIWSKMNEWWKHNTNPDWR